jgi:hypothetical protein
MSSILIAILQVLGVIATPDLLTNAEFTRQHEAEIKRANEIYTTHHYKEVDGTVIVVDVNP